MECDTLGVVGSVTPHLLVLTAVYSSRIDYLTAYDRWQQKGFISSFLSHQTRPLALSFFIFDLLHVSQKTQTQKANIFIEWRVKV